MASSGQSPFGLYMTLASVALSLVAVTTVTTKQDGTLMNAASKRQRRKKASQTRPQPTRRSADDGLQVEPTGNAGAIRIDEQVIEDRAIVEPEAGTAQTIEDQQQAETAAAISRTAKLSRALRARRDNGEDVTELQNELFLVTADLCRLQQELIVNPESTSSKDDFETSFGSSMQSIKETFSTLESTLMDNAPSSEALSTIQRQLQDERPALESLSGLPAPTHLPPTPPSDAVPDKPLQPTISSQATPQPSPPISFDTGVTPSAARVEPPPEYLPPVDPIPMPTLIKSDSTTEVPPVETTVLTEEEESPAALNDDAIYSAVTENDGDSLTKLLSNGLDPTAQFGELQRTALHQAAHLNHVDCLHTLLRHGAVLRTEDAKGDTALHLAAWVGNTEAITALLEHGADVDWLSGRDGYSPLWCAVSAHQTAAAKLLLRHGAQVSLRAGTGTTKKKKSASSAGDGGMTPLHQAAVTGQGEMCSLLIAHGASVNGTDDDRSTPLHYAAVSGSVPAVAALLREGADLEARQLHGLTAAHWAAHKGHVDVLALLLDYGARVDPRAGEGATPLHLAASRGHVRAACLLLDRGAKNGGARASWAGVAGTPADMAGAKGHEELARVLRGWGTGS